MKKQILLGLSVVLCSLALGVLSVKAHAASLQTFKWESLKTLLVECAVQPYRIETSGQKVLYPLKSTCSDRLSVDGNTARFILNGREYQAWIVDSANSDDGDLNDVFVATRSGKIVASMHHVLGFGDILLALAGGSSEAFAQIQEE